LALGDILEGLKVFGLIQKPKLAGRHKGKILCWASKRKPKYQSKIQPSMFKSHSGLDAGCGIGSYSGLDAGCKASISLKPISFAKVVLVLLHQRWFCYEQLRLKMGFFQRAQLTPVVPSCSLQGRL
jgi:hypothetical protein